MLNIKNLVFKKKPIKKLIKQYIGPYIIEEIILANEVKLKLLVSMRIHLVVNISQVMRLLDKEYAQKMKLSIEKLQNTLEEYWQKLSRKEIILQCNRNYAVLALNYVLKNSKKIISVLGTERKDKNKI